MRPARIILVVVALVAGGLAAFLVMRTRAPAPAAEVVTQVVQEQKTQVLVAKAPIGIGERLKPDTLEWQDWPEGAVRPEYVTVSAMPDAPAKLTGAVARFEFFPGEPIREQKLVRSDQGYLSAVLAPGMRGVAVGVNAVSSAGGFVVPNDHVDVLLTTSTPTGQQSEVVLSNVRVLAIGKRLGEMGASGGDENAQNDSPTPETFDKSTVATLELTPGQAETLINASMRGQLSLTLRSITDFGKGGDAQRPSSTSQAVRVIRFGKEQSVMAGTVAQAAPAFSSGDEYASDGGYSENNNDIQVEAVEPQLMPQ
ncbi:MAG TPA: Flp pilus assembly protein CpaB [Devosia sp.]|nr:Flp pilus assembly protein CpaB [Devosia sp.]